MNKEYIQGEKEADIFVRQLLNIGEAMYLSGGEISRIEDSLHRLGKRYGARHVSVFAITSSITVTAEFDEDYSVTQNRRITKRGSIDCVKMEKLNQVCRECAENPIPVEELRERVLAILEVKPSDKRVYIGQIIAATFFALFFGGNFLDAAVAGLAVVLICALQRFVKPYFTSELFFNVTVSFMTGLFVNLLNLVIPGLHVNQILIGDIMVLIPGIAITNSIRYILSGDLVSSFEKLMDSLMQAFGIATGFMLSVLLVKGNIADAPSFKEPFGLILQLLAATLGTLGFSIVFHVRKQYIAVTTFGGLLCWSVYLLMQYIGMNVFSSTLVAAVAIGLYGEIFAHILKVPTTILFIPACIPLIPGGNLYYSAMGLITGDIGAFKQNILLLTLYAFGISLGLALVLEIERICTKIDRRQTGSGN